MATLLDKDGLQYYTNQMVKSEKRKVNGKPLPSILDEIDLKIDEMKTLFEQEYSTLMSLELENNKNVYKVGSNDTIDRSSDVENGFTDIQIDGKTIINNIIDSNEDFVSPTPYGEEIECLLKPNTQYNFKCEGDSITPSFVKINGTSSVVKEGEVILAEGDIDNRKDKSIKVDKIYGKTEQNPSKLDMINSSGELVVDSAGKPILNNGKEQYKYDVISQNDTYIKRNGKDILAENTYADLSKNIVIKGKSYCNLLHSLSVLTLYNGFTIDSQTNSVRYFNDKDPAVPEDYKLHCRLQFASKELRSILPNKKYTFIFKIKNFRFLNGQQSMSGSSWIIDSYSSSIKNSTSWSNANTSGFNAFVFETKDVIDTNLFNISVVNTKVAFELYDMAIVEGDITSDITYSPIIGIDSVGRSNNNKIIIKTTGKNMFTKGFDVNTNPEHIKEITDSYVVMASNRTGGWIYSQIKTLDVVIGKIYTLSFKVDAIKGKLSNCAIKLFKDKTDTGSFNGYINQAYQSNNFKVTFTANNDKVTLLAYTVRDAEDPTSIENEFKLYDFQLEESSVATSYEPYQETVKEIQLSAPLRSLPNGTCDTIEKICGKYMVVRRIGEKTFTGNEEWEFNSNIGVNSQLYRYMLRGQSYFKNSTNAGYASCNRLYVRDKILQEEMEYLLMRDDMESGGVYIAIKHTTVNNFKAWLNSNPVTVNYELKDVVYEEIPNFDINSYNNITRITTNNNIKPVIELDIPSKTNNQYSVFEKDSKNLIIPYQLKSLGNGVKDSIEYLNGSYKLIQRVGKVQLTGNENIQLNLTNESFVRYSIINIIDSTSPYNGESWKNLICDKVPTMGDKTDRETIFTAKYLNESYNSLVICLKKVVVPTLADFINWVKANKPVIYYELKTPILTDLGVNDILTLKPYRSKTFIHNIFGVTPAFSVRVPYINISSIQSRGLTLTSPSDVTNVRLQLSGSGVAKKVMLSESDLRYVPFFKGLQSVGRKSKNIVDESKHLWIGGVELLKDNTLRYYDSPNGRSLKDLEVMPNRNYVLSASVNSFMDRRFIYFLDKNKKYISSIQGVNKFKTPPNCYYVTIYVGQDPNKPCVNIQVENAYCTSDYVAKYNGVKIKAVSNGKNLANNGIEYSNWVVGNDSANIKYEKVENGYILDNLLDRISRNNTLANYLKHGETYTVSCDVEFLQQSADNHIQYYMLNRKGDSGFNYGTQRTNSGVLRWTFVYNEEMPILGIYTSKEATVARIKIKVTDIRITLGSSDGGYEDYKNDDIELLLNEPLRSINNDVKDSLECINGKWVVVRRCKEIILNGTENWRDGREADWQEADGMKGFFFYPIPETPFGSSGLIKCDKMNLSESKFIEGVKHGGKWRWIGINISWDRLEGFTAGTSQEDARNMIKRYLQANNITVVLPLQTPVVEDINPLTLKCWTNGVVSLDGFITCNSKHSVSLNKPAQILRNIEEFTELRSRVASLEASYDSIALEQSRQIKLLKHSYILEQ